MKTKKGTKKTRAEPPTAAGDTRSPNAIDSKALRQVEEADAQFPEVPRPETFTKHIARQTLRAFLDAVKMWQLSDTESARLVGAEPASVEAWKAGKAPTNEEVLARMTMVALIRTALDIAFSSSLANEWMRLPNSGYPHLGLSPVAYVNEHGWPGLFFVLRQVQARADGN